MLLPCRKSYEVGMRLILLIPFAVSACASFPALEGSISDTAAQAPYPILTEIPAAPAGSRADQPDLLARIMNLQARAARIRQIDMAALQ